MTVERVAEQHVRELAGLDVDEKTWERQLIGNQSNPGLARQLGWRYAYHVLRSKGSAPGFPDWVICRERVVFLELKTESGKLSDPQAVWLHALLAAGAETYVVRPSDLDAIGKVLAHRARPMTVWQRLEHGPVLAAFTALRDATTAEIERTLG